MCVSMCVSMCVYVSMCVCVYVHVCHPLLAIFPLSSTAFCTYSLGSHDTLRHCQRARACRCGGEKSRALRQGTVFQLFGQMALWDTLGSGMDQHFAPELFAGTSKTTTFYKGTGIWFVGWRPSGERDSGGPKRSENGQMFFLVHHRNVFSRAAQNTV